jgi:hypothetical protein
MHKLILSFALILATLFALPIAPARAQLARTWVSHTGSDGNTCNYNDPCLTFAIAFSKTFAGGEINCLDQGLFLAVGITINKSITIDCEGIQGRIPYTAGPGNPPGGSPITVQAAATDIVVLRGLDIDNVTGGGAGVAFTSGGALHIEKCVIRNFNSTGLGWGISATPNNSGAQLFVSDTVLENNGTSSSGGGISVESNAPSGVLRVSLNRVEARNNFFGIKADGAFATGGVTNMTVRDSVAFGNHSNGIVATGTSDGPAIIMMIEHSTSSQNATAGFGIIADGPKTTIALSGSTVMGNINGIGASNGGQLISYSDNKVNLNSADGSPTSVFTSK